MAIGPDRRRMTSTDTYEAAIDVGLRKYMLGVYNYMALGVAFTGLMALAIANVPELMYAVAGTGLKWVLFIGILGLGWMAPRIIISRSTAAAHACFWIYAGLWGALMAPMFYLYAGDTLARVFFITTGAFAGLSLFGYTTKRDLSPMGAMLCMATFGLLIAFVVNIFFIQSGGFDLLISIAVVLVFSALTAFQTQMIKNLYHEGDAAEVQTRKSIFGAFALYGCFVTLFIWLLHLFGIGGD